MINFFKNKLLTIPAFIFFLTVYGVIVLSTYASRHRIPFYDLISSQALIAIGGASLILIIFSSLYLAMAIWVTFQLSKYVLKDNFSDNPKWLILYITYALMLSISFFIFTMDVDDFYISITIAILSFIPLSIINKLGKKESSHWLLFKFVLFCIVILFAIFLGGLIFLLINKINESIYYDAFLSLFLFFSLIFILPVKIKESKKNIIIVMNPEERKRYLRKKLESKVIYYSLVGLVVILILPLKTNVSDNVIKYIGIGFEDRCYYSQDLIGHKIPNYLIDEENGISKVFVLSDISNKIYLSGLDGEFFSYSFNYERLNRIACPEFFKNK